MAKKKQLKGIIIVTMILIACFSRMHFNVHASGEEQEINKFNVVIVLDASNSMNYTDSKLLRFKAISQFTNLLAEEGNMLGCVVYSDHVVAKQDLLQVSNQSMKEQVINILKSVAATGYTNTGEALTTAVDMIKANGNPELPSVILFLSDGNTEMPTAEELTVSLDQKANAIQAAREEKIAIYSVCLNANNKADVTEMEQISNATGGAFEEVKSAEDLKGVFNNFYNLIYGTSTIMLVDNVFPDTGVLEEPFGVPGIGVEEVNILVNGASTNLELLKPDGTKCDATQMSVIVEDSFSMVKIKNVEPGEWKILVYGNPGGQVKINMVYNTNLMIDVTGPVTGEAYTNVESTFTAQLRSGNVVASSKEQYTGYEAVLEILDINDNIIATEIMELEDNGYTMNYQFSKGVYYYQVHITGNYLEKVSTKMGPLSVTTEKTEKVEEQEQEPENTAPEAIESKVKKIVYVWPFKGGAVEIDLTTLARDKEDNDLTYKILSSSFIENTDYTIDGNILKQNHFSLSRGSYTVRAMDKGGLTCEIEVEIQTRNVGVMALIGIGIIALIVLAIVGIGLYIALTKPFGGAIYVQGYMNGNYSDKIKQEKKRGRIKLSRFGLDSTGFNYAQCYFQATGDTYVYLITKKPVFYSGRLTNKIRIENGAETTITLDQEGNQRIYIRFESRLRERRRTRR